MKRLAILALVLVVAPSWAAAGSSVDRAIEMLVGALETGVPLDEKNPAAFLLLGEALETSGDLGGALEACEKAAALNDRFGPAHGALARILEKLGETGKARAHLKKALELGVPVDPRLKRRLLGS